MAFQFSLGRFHLLELHLVKNAYSTLSVPRVTCTIFSFRKSAAYMCIYSMSKL